MLSWPDSDATALARMAEREVAAPRKSASPTAIFSRSANSAAPSILLVATLRWPTAARLAIAFAQLGCRVEAVCPRDHSCVSTRAVQRTHPYDLLRSRSTLRAAIEAAAADLIIPCDDHAARELHRLYVRAMRAGGRASALAAGIERSLGSPAASALVMERFNLAALVGAEGLRAPPSAPLSCVADLDAWLDEHPLPAVLKTDGSWGGRGVAIVHRRDEAHRVLQGMLALPSAGHCLARAFLERDVSPLLAWMNRTQFSITVQEFIAGRPANRAVACWQGKVLAGISVEAIQTQHPTGPATVVRVIDNPEMAEASERIVRRLGVSGLWGIDFVVEEASSAAHLVEINPRATPICHLPLGHGRDLIAALFHQLAERAPCERPAALDLDRIALFPGEWRRDPASAYLASSYHDIPWKEADLVRDCIALPWEERGWLARAWARFQRARSRRRPEAAMHLDGDARTSDVGPLSVEGTVAPAPWSSVRHRTDATLDRR